MTYADIVVAIIYAMQMMICVLFALPYKRSKKHIILLAIVTIIEYYCVKLATLDIRIYWLAYVVEFFGTLVVLALFNSGNIWRNFMISWFNFQCANVLIIIEGAISSYFIDINSIVIFGATGNDKYVFFEILFMLFNALVALTISKKLFKENYNPENKTYKYIVAIIVIVGTTLGLKKNYMIAEVREGSGLGVYKIYTTAILIIIVVMYLVGYFYNLSEKKRLLKEREELKEIIEKNYKQYENIVDSNKKLESIKDKVKTLDDIPNMNISNLSLSGNLTLDTIISNYDSKARENNITFEISIAPLKSDISRDMSLATIIDDLMDKAIGACLKHTKEKWISMGIRQDSSNVIIKLEYSKPESYNIKMKDIKLIHKIVSFREGAIDLNCKENEVRVDILLP